MKFWPLYYRNKQNWLKSDSKKVTLIGMSGVGKTHIARILNKNHGWLQYSVDYMIGSEYMKASIEKQSIESFQSSDDNKFSIQNLSALSKYLANPGDIAHNGLPFNEYLDRQREHKNAEELAMSEIPHFLKKNLKKHRSNFVCDTSGSLCEIVNPKLYNDKILSTIAKHTLIILIKETSSHIEKLKERFKKAPKPMYYNENFLKKTWKEFCIEKDVVETTANPNEFSIYGFEKLIAHRSPIYKTIAQYWGIEISASDLSKVKSEEDFNELVGIHLPEN